MSQALRKMITAIANVFKYHKAKVGLVILSTLLIGVMIFPYDDLGDLVSSLVSKGSGNQVYLKFSNLGIDLFPSPGLSLKDVEMDTPVATGIKAGELSISPSIPSLLMFKAGGTARLTDFLNGNFILGFQGRNSVTATDGSGHYEISAESLDVAQVTKVMDIDFPLRGRISLEAEGDVDATFAEPARAEFDLTAEKLQMLPMMFNIPQFGPMNLPGVLFSQVGIKGRFLPQDRESSRNQVNQDLILEEVVLGADRDPIQGRVRGKLEVRMMTGGGGVRPILDTYDLRIQITAKPAAQKDFGLYLSFLDKHKKETAAGSVYTFRVAGRAMGSPPELTTLQAFQ